MENTQIIHNQPDVKEIWSGIGGHFDSLGQIINEFVDNSISNFDANSPIQKNICIQLREIEKDGNVEVIIEDTGTGISNLDAAFTLGGRAGAESPLNEHGFGMKHALATANPENNSWAIYTKNLEDAKNNRFRLIEAPYAIGEYQIKVMDSSTEEWPGVYSLKTGTLVKFICSREMYRTIYKLATNFVSIADALAEDLGFTYANIIADGRASILLRIIPRDGESKDANVGAMMPTWEQYIEPGSGIEQIDLGGGNIKLQYEFGIFSELGERAPFDNKTSKRHYKHSMLSSGVEIRLNGRIICSNLFYEIWGIEKHNSYNNFLAKLNLISDSSEALPKTRTSKNGLREGDEKLETLFRWIRAKVNKPPKDMSFATHETDLFEKLKEIRERSVGMMAREKNESYSCKTEMHAFMRSGNASDKIRIDLFESIGKNNYVYEGKADTTTSKDVYQLRMYWDGLVYDGIIPSKGYLVAKEHSESVLDIIGIVNTMEDANGNSYNFEAITWESLGINQQ